MTEAEWLGCDDPTPMLGFLDGMTSDRKLRLFACACCRWLWGTSLTDPVLQKAVVAAEHFADGMADEEELIQVQEELKAIGGSEFPRSRIIVAKKVAWVPSDYITQWGGSAYQAKFVSLGARIVEAVDANLGEGTEAAVIFAAECSRRHASLLRCVVANPFHVVSLAPSYRTVAVTALAQQAYNERTPPHYLLTPSRLSVLADALEQGGCTDAGILSHLRSPGPHVRGCWAVDLLLGKE